MIKYFILVAIILQCSFAFAGGKQFMLNMGLNINGQEQNFELLTMTGTSSSVSQISDQKNGSGTKIEVFVTEQTIDDTYTLLMKFKIFKVHNGKHHLLSTPQIHTVVGEEALVEVGQKGKKMLTLKVKPTAI